VAWKGPGPGLDYEEEQESVFFCVLFKALLCWMDVSWIGLDWIVVSMTGFAYWWGGTCLEHMLGME